MSHRTWLGAGRKSWADYNRSDYPSLESLCADAMWRLPAKAYAPDRDTLTRFLEVLNREYGMTWDDFWELKVGDEGRWEDYASTPTRGSLEAMAVFGAFLKAKGGAL